MKDHLAPSVNCKHFVFFEFYRNLNVYQRIIRNVCLTALVTDRKRS